MYTIETPPVPAHSVLKMRADSTDYVTTKSRRAYKPLAKSLKINKNSDISQKYREKLKHKASFGQDNQLSQKGY
jgi:hypothetical protein